MDSVFHYHSVYFLAKHAGFSPKDAEILGVSSTYVDHNLVPLHILTNGGVYETIPTHHFGFWDKKQEESVWIPFHFFPSGSSEENPFLRSAPQGQAKNKQQLALMVRPNSEPVKELLIEALKTRNLYRVGIALHTYADSWAHQGFTGTRSAHNVLSAASPVPPIGHAQAGRLPDSFFTLWTDPRRQEPIMNNPEIFRQAAQKVYRYLSTYNHRSFADEDFVLDELMTLLGNTREMVKTYLKAFSNTALTVQSENVMKRGVATLSKLVINKVADTDNLQSFLPKHVSWSSKNQTLDLDLHSDIPPYSRGTWKKQALMSDNAMFKEELNDELFEKHRDTFQWLKHEILHRSKLLEPSTIQGSADFEQSHYFRWMEAAKNHLACARTIMRNALC